MIIKHTQSAHDDDDDDDDDEESPLSQATSSLGRWH